MKKSVFSDIADSFGLPVKIVELMHRKGLITDKLTDSDREFLFKYTKLWLNQQALRAQIRRLSKKDRDELIKTISLPEMSGVEKWAFTRWYNILSDIDRIPPRVYEIAEEIQSHFKIENYLCAAKIAKKAKRMVYDKLRYERKKVRCLCMESSMLSGV